MTERTGRVTERTGRVTERTGKVTDRNKKAAYNSRLHVTLGKIPSPRLEVSLKARLFN
ncbi:hypothetical protein [Lysinibacillus sphaericus]|uniref:hypothetical protein n=1 Tax=Lysinibacillus sphaericus TaxID=1421 RepID=UPI003D05690D